MRKRKTNSNGGMRPVPQYAPNQGRGLILSKEEGMSSEQRKVPPTRMARVFLVDGSGVEIGDTLGQPPRKVLGFGVRPVSVPGIGNEVAAIDEDGAPIVVWPYHALLGIETERTGEQKVLDT